MFVVQVSGCTFTATGHDSCDSSAQCRETFGFGSFCNSGGLCEESSALSRCSRTLPEDLLENRRDYTNYVPVGAIFPRGSDPVFASMENSARLAIKTVNGEQGVVNRPFGLVMCNVDELQGDGLTSEEAAVLTARHLIDEIDVRAIIGPATSDNTAAVFNEVRNDDVVIVSPSATAETLSTLDTIAATDDKPGLLWRTAAPDSQQAVGMAVDMRSPGTGRVAPVASAAVIHISGPYGAGLNSRFVEEFRQRGGAVVSYEFSSIGSRDSAIAQAPNPPGGTSPDEIVFISNRTDDVRDFLNAVANLPAYDNKGIFLSEVAADPDILQAVDSTRLSQVRGTRPKPLSPADNLVYATFLAAYIGEYDDPQVSQRVFSANAYDAGWLVAYGAAWALLNEDSLSGTNIARGLRQLTTPNGLATTVGAGSWNSILREFIAGRGINISGASGELDYDSGDEETTSPVEVWTVNVGSGTVNAQYTVGEL